MELRIVRRLLPVLLLCTALLRAQTTVAVPAASGSGIKSVLPASTSGHIFGVNLDDTAYYGNAQLTSNLVSTWNLSFEEQMFNQLSTCASGTTSTWVDTAVGSPQPTNFWQGATYQVVSGADLGNSGTITSSVASSGSKGQTLNGTYSAGCSYGDQMLLRCRTSGGTCAGGYTAANAGLDIQTTGNGAVSFETTDLSPSSSSPQGLEMVAPNTSKASITVAFDASLASNVYINLNGNYTLTFRAKGTSGAPVISYIAARVVNNPIFISGAVTPTVSSTPGAGWTNYSETFTASETGFQSGSATGQLVLSVTGGTVLLQDVALTETPTGNNSTVFRNAVFQRIQALNPGILRFMTGNQWGCTFDNMIANYSGRRLCGSSPWVQSGGTIAYGLNDFLNLAKAVGADPWWTFSVYTTPSDMANIAAYMSGACGNGNPYTAIRCNSGQTTPWTSVFNHIYLEMGNEIWAQVNAGSGSAYGTILGANVAAFKASPFYTSNMKIVASGFILQPKGPYGWNAGVLAAAQAITNGLPDYIDGAPYQYGYMTDTSSNQNIFGPMFAEPINFTSSTATGINAGLTYQLQNYANTNFGVQGAIYETNMGTQCGLAGVTQSTINNVVAGIGSGLDATLNMLLSVRDAGVKVINLFALPEIENSFSTATSTTSGACNTASALYSPLWGMNRIMPGPTNSGVVDRPVGIALQLVNSAMKPNLLNVVQSGTPTYNQAAEQPIPQGGASITAVCNGTTTAFSISPTFANLFSNGTQTASGTGIPANTAVVSYNPNTNTAVLSNACSAGGPVSISVIQNSIAANAAVPLVQTFGFSDGAGSYSLIAYNLSLTNSEAITFFGAAAPAGTVTKTVFTSTNITDNNEAVAIGGTPVVSTPSSTTLANPAGDTLPPFSITTYAWTIPPASNPTVPTGTVTSSLNPSMIAQPVTFTATLTGSSAAPPGQVVFMDGATPLGTVVLTPTSSTAVSSTATLTISTLPAGTDPITVSYAATQNFSATVSPVLNQVVLPILSSTATLTASPNPALAGQTVTLTAGIAGSSTTPAGLVSFYDGGMPLGSGAQDATGHATYTTAALTVGTHSLTAIYAGNTAYSASTSPAVFEVIQPIPQDFTIVLANPSVTIQSQHHLTGSVMLTSLNGFTDTLVLNCANLPAYVTCRLTPSTAALPANSSIAASLYIDTDAALGYAWNGSVPPLPVDSPFNLALLLSPVGLFAGVATVALRRLNIRLRLLVLLLASVPTVFAFSGCGSSITPLAIPPSTTAGSYTLPITATGTATGIAHTVQLTLIVTP